jgi:hypothetical protein
MKTGTVIVIAWISGVVCLMICSYLVSMNYKYEIKNNEIQGYHCQPITTHSTIEEAKAKIREYQGNES